MAKAILEFDLTEKDDIEAHKRAVKALDLVLALNDMGNHFRSQLKYNEDLTDEAYKVLEETKDRFYEILREYSISFDELIS